MKIGVMMPGQSPEVTTGGNALKFYASVRLAIRRIGAIKKGDEIIGNQTKIKVVKNKLAPPFKQVVTEILYGEGISREGELIDMGAVSYTHLDVYKRQTLFHAGNGYGAVPTSEFDGDADSIVREYDPLNP